MTSTILYKFRSATSYESISLPGTNARLFDIKKAIVKAKDLYRKNDPSNRAVLDFDLTIKNAMTNESYEDENMILPRGTRCIVHRLPAAKGQGLIARLTRADAGLVGSSNSTGSGTMHSSKGGGGNSTSGKGHGGSGGVGGYGNPRAAENGYYTMQNKDEDEFVDINTSKNNNPSNINTNSTTVTTTITSSIKEEEEEEYNEEAKLIAAIPSNIHSSNHSNNNMPNKPFSSIPLSKFPKPIHHHPTTHIMPQSSTHARPNADPILREIEQQQALLENSNKPCKKTGIPRTFHPPSTSGNPSDATSANDSDTNNIKHDSSIVSKAFETGFNQLLDRGGGQSTSSTLSKKNDLEYALQLTATTIPGHLQCGICHKVVKNAMFIPWDDEGRSTCELCIRKGLSENRLRCPLTGQDGVSPDDLKPNKGVREAAKAFEKSVMDKMKEIIQQKEEEEEIERKKEEERVKLSVNGRENGNSSSTGNIVDYEGTANEKGAILRKGMLKRGGKKSYEDDMFDGEDDFGGDVFAVTRIERKENNDDDINDIMIESKEEEKGIDIKEESETNGDNTISKDVVTDNNHDNAKDHIDGVEKSIGDNTSDIIKTNIHSKNDVGSSSILQSDRKRSDNDNEVQNSKDSHNINADKNNDSPSSPQSSTSTMTRREKRKSRAPPAGYVMGPAGINQNTPKESSGGRQHNFRGQGGRGFYHGRQGNQRGRGGNSFNNNRIYQQSQQGYDQNNENNGGRNKRTRSDFEANNTIHDNADNENFETRSQSSHNENKPRGGRGRGFGRGGRGFDGSGYIPPGNNFGGIPQGDFGCPPPGALGNYGPPRHQGGRGTNFGGPPQSDFGSPPPGAISNYRPPLQQGARGLGPMNYGPPPGGPFFGGRVDFIRGGGRWENNRGRGAGRFGGRGRGRF